MEVIDIPSSPEPLPVVSGTTRGQGRPVSHTQKRRVPPPPARRVAAEEIIEITDSDSEPAPKPVPPKEKRPVHYAQEISRDAGPSIAKVPVFGVPPIHLLQASVTSGSSSSHDNETTAAPLFYPDNEDLEIQETPANQGLENPPGPVLPVVHPPATPPPPQQPLEPPAPTADTADAYVARALEIVPNVLPAHVLGLVKQILHHPDNGGQNVLELVLHSLFENPDYPKVDRNGKRKRTEDDDGDEGSARGQPVPKIDYGSKDREFKGGLYYFELSLVWNSLLYGIQLLIFPQEQLMIDFPYIPKPYLRTRLLENRFYAPTHLLLVEEEARDPPPYIRKSVPSRVSGKIRARVDIEFETERQWILQQQGARIATSDAHLEAANDDSDDECEDGIECGCCFSSYPFVC